MSYNYGPPPPAPPTASPPNAAGYSPYGQPYQSHRGGHGGGRGRGGPPHGDRGGYHASPPAYQYGAQQAQPQQPYAPHHPAPYPSAGGYPQQQPQQQQQQQSPQHGAQQQWHAGQGPPHVPQPAGQTPLLTQNYHPNYAPQVYHNQQQAYNAQQPYANPPPPQYSQGYQPPPPNSGPPAQQWGGHQPPQDQFGRGRGGYNDRGGSKAMGPPIRMGFEAGSHAGHHAPVSNPYPPQPYNGPPPPTQYPSAYGGGYPPPGPYVPGPPQHDSHSGQQQQQQHHHNNHRSRGGFNNNYKSRPQFTGDKNRQRSRGPQPQTPSNHHQKPDAASAGKKKKRKTNVLGLTPGDESEEDDENEEERLNEMIGGYVSNISTSAEIATWVAERRANFPTKSRIEGKKVNNAQNESTKQVDEDAALKKQAEKLRRQLEKVEATMKRKREAQDEGDEMRDIDVSSVEIKSDDDAPEVQSSRPTQSQGQGQLPPPPKKADPTKHCKYYSTGGTCGKKGKCRFVHDPAVREAALKERELNGGRMTLQQRLTLNDKEQEDLTIVKTLKYLQDRGVLKHRVGTASSPTSAAPAAASSNQPPAPNLDLPPIPPPSVVSNGAATKYNGWNLSGFGNTGVKSGD